MTAVSWGDRALTFQARVREWVSSTFGVRYTISRRERTERFAEEAGELCQASGMSREDAHRLVDFVWDRPKGELAQELGGVMNTLAAWSEAHDLDMLICGERELQRCWQKQDVIKAKRAAKPPVDDEYPE